MTVKITQRIKGFKVVDETVERPAAAATDGKTTKVTVWRWTKACSARKPSSA